MRGSGCESLTSQLPKGPWRRCDRSVIVLCSLIGPDLRKYLSSEWTTVCEDLEIACTLGNCANDVLARKAFGCERSVTIGG